MGKWRAYASVVGTKYLGEIEADTEEEAKELAINCDEAWVSLCHHCSSQCEDAAVDDVTVEEVERD